MDSQDLAPLLPAIVAECDARYPAEACGLLLADGHGKVRFIAIPNIAGTFPAAQTSSRSRRDGYVMDPQRLVTELEAADAAGGALCGIVHSHPDVGAYFSKEDRDMALAGGDSPLWPGVDYLVVSTRAEGSDEARLFRWDAPARDFAEEQIQIPLQLKHL